MPCSDQELWAQLAGNAALFRAHQGTVRHVNGMSLGEVWRFPDERFATSARDRQLARLIEQIARHHGIDMEEELPQELAAVARDFLDRQPVGQAQVRKPTSARSRLRPDLRLIELFDAWQAKTDPSGQTAHEYRKATENFIDFVGDIPVIDITHDDLLNYRDEATELPRSMPRADRELPSPNAWPSTPEAARRG